MGHNMAHDQTMYNIWVVCPNIWAKYGPLYDAKIGHSLIPSATYVHILYSICEVHRMGHNMANSMPKL